MSDVEFTEPVETIRYTADVVCIRDGAVLLIERGWPPHKGQFALPGGHVDTGETSRAAAARELLEETGVQVDADALTLVGVYDAPGRDPRGRYVTVAYAVTVPADTTAQAGDDAAAVRWAPLADPGDLAFDHKSIVTDAWRQQTAHAETVAGDAFTAITGDNPSAARRVLDAASFRDRALIAAWAEELSRLVQQARNDYEYRERGAWRDSQDRDSR